MTTADPSNRSSIALPLAAIVVAMAAFQVGAAIAKGMFPAIGSEGAAALRLLLGAAMLVAVVRPWRAWPRPAPLFPLFGLGACMAGAVLFFYLAVGRLPLGVAIALQFLGPLSVAIFGSRKPTDLIWAALAGAGVWSLVGVDRSAGALDPVGIVFALAAAASWAGYILCGRPASAAFGTSTAALAVSIAAVIVLPVGVHRAGAALLSADLLPIALLVALLSTVIPFSLEMYALPRLPARTFATFTSLEPVFGVLSGLFILGERLTAIQVGGVAMVITAAAGAAWSSAGRRRATAADAPPT